MREIKQYFVGKKAVDGAGVHLNRIFGYYEIPDFDPFLLLDFFDSKNPEDYIKGFPWHPHRGIETITYMISGSMEHEDSLGNKGMINPGDCQWMSAGSGILHKEMPEESEHMFGTQLWLNLSKEDKMSSPEYREITSDMIKTVEEKDTKVHIIAGEYKDIEGPIILEKTKPLYLDIEIDANSQFIIEVEEELNIFAFVIDGDVNFNNKSERYIGKGTGVLYEKEGTKIKFNTDDISARVLLIGGKPLNEEISWGGPIVMNTKEELDLAFKELEENKFIK